MGAGPTCQWPRRPLERALAGVLVRAPGLGSAFSATRWEDAEAAPAGADVAAARPRGCGDAGIVGAPGRRVGADEARPGRRQGGALAGEQGSTEVSSDASGCGRWSWQGAGEVGRACGQRGRRTAGAQLWARSGAQGWCACAYARWPGATGGITGRRRGRGARQPWARAGRGDASAVAALAEAVSSRGRGGEVGVHGGM